MPGSATPASRAAEATWARLPGSGTTEGAATEGAAAPSVGGIHEGRGCACDIDGGGGSGAGPGGGAGWRPK